MWRVAICLLVACEPAEPTPAADAASIPTAATAADGGHISWREHRIDDEELGGVAIRGADGSVMGDLDRDGYLDIVSVHESDTEYDGVADGHVRVAFGSPDPDRWELATLVDGPDAGAAEDAAIGDLNGDGWPDVVAACELGHLVYLENPGADARSAPWARLIPPVVTGRGSFIRVFLADFDQDGRPEIVTANKGAQNPGPNAAEPQPISWFELRGDPLDPASWVEHELTRVPWPINSQPVDLDGDGDLDVLGGSVAESRVFWFENVTDGDIRFREHRIEIDGTSIPAADRPPGEEDTDRALVTGFNVDFADLNGDGRLDIVLAEDFRYLVWLEQPQRPEDAWRLHAIGNTVPDQLVGLAVADIDGDGDPDVFTGGYSRGPRDSDGGVTVSDPLGRLAWFENTGVAGATWTRHDISRRQRGMFDKFLPRDMDGDGDVDFVSTRGNSSAWDGVFWLEQVRSPEARPAFERAREVDSPEMPLPVATFAFGVYGDGPYFFWENARHRRLLADAESADLEWLVHVGDIVWSPGSNEALRKRRDQLDALDLPVVYTPGDNEWTDRYKARGSSVDPLDHLDALRRIFFDDPHHSLGGRPMPVTSQASSADHAGFPENAMWQRGGFVFATLHIVGSWNGTQHFPGRTAAHDEEVRLRTNAAVAWMDRAFASAAADSASGIVLITHANVRLETGGAGGPYEPIASTLESHVSRFPGQVLVIHGDTHEQRVDHPLRDRAGAVHENFTRIETFGSPDIGWVRVVVDSIAGRVVQFEPRLMRGWF